MKLLQPGDTIPKFSLPDQDGVLTNFSCLMGTKTLIYFYPKAMTPGCTIQACQLRDNMNIFKKNFNTEIIGISIDKPDKLLEFSEKEMLNFTLLSDSDHKISEKFGVWGEKKFMGKKYYGIHRTSFIINNTGIIKKIFQNFKPNEHVNSILNYLRNDSKTIDTKDIIKTIES